MVRTDSSSGVPSNLAASSERLSPFSAIGPVITSLFCAADSASIPRTLDTASRTRVGLFLQPFAKSFWTAETETSASFASFSCDLGYQRDLNTEFRNSAFLAWIDSLAAFWFFVFVLMLSCIRTLFSARVIPSPAAAKTRLLGFGESSRAYIWQVLSRIESSESFLRLQRESFWAGSARVVTRETCSVHGAIGGIHTTPAHVKNKCTLVNQITQELSATLTILLILIVGRTAGSAEVAA